MSVRNFLAFLGLRNFFQRWFCSRPWALPFSSCWLCTSDKPVQSDFIFFLQKSLRDSVIRCSSLHRLFRGIMGKKLKFVVTVANQFTEQKFFGLGLLLKTKKFSQFFWDNSLLFRVGSEFLGFLPKFLVSPFLFYFFIYFFILKNSNLLKISCSQVNLN